MKQKSRILNRVVAVASTLAMTLPMLNGLMTASAAETEQYPYTLFGRNGISVNTSHLCINGNLHANTTVEITSNSRNVNGKITTADTEIDRVKHVYADSKIYETYFAENGTVYEEAYTWDEMNIHVNSPVFSYGNMDVSGNISLNSCLGSFMDLTLTGEVSNANNAVLYSKYGDITVDTDNVANINGLIYAPLGTLTIDAPNVNLNGLIIADAIIINGSTVNINGNSNLARFIGNTSEAYDFSGLEYLPEAWLGDADEDGLFDLYEKVIDTDPQNEDTDGDALPDGHEVLILNTDPLLTDSDDNGIADSDEDFDTDGLTNLEEYLQQTESFTADTDSDGLTDGEEVHTTKTNPLDSDTDDDKLIDGDEGKNGAIYLQYGILFEPLQPDTDGNGILDGDEVFEQTLEQEIVTEDEVITQVTVDMETNGNIAQNLTIESMQDVDALSSNVVGLIGEPLEFTSATEFDSATISFTIDQSKLGDTAFDNLLILWYNEEEGIFEEMPTDRDRVNSIVSTTTTHFSQYLVVDSVKWYASWENGFRQMDDACGDDIVVEYPLHTYFLIDCSEKMGDVDPFNRRKTICQNIIDNMQSFDKASVATFSRGIAFDSDLTSSKSTLNYYLSRINNDGSETNIAAALGPTLTEIYETIPGEPYRIIILTHGGADFNAVKAAMWQFDNQFENGTVNIINLSSSVMSEDAISFAQHSGGDVYYAAEAHELTTQVGTAITYPAPFDNTDRDGDSIPDIVERYGLKPDGTLINSDPYKTDTDGDGLTDSEELGFVPFDAILHAPGEYLQHITYRSDPNNPDTDGDEFPDNYLSTMSSEEYYPYTDPNPTVSDVTIHRIEHEDYLRINYDNTPSFGSAQEWLESMTDTMFCNGEVAPSEARAHGCGFIAACDVLAYLNIHNGMDMSKYMSEIWHRDTDTTTPIRQLAQLVSYDENTDLIGKDGYLHYLQQMSDELYIHTSGITGVRPFGEQSFESAFNEAFEMCDLPYEANWCFDNSEATMKKRIFEMIGNNIPVIFAYYGGFVATGNELSVYELKNKSYDGVQDIDGHYMTITGIIEYSSCANLLIGHSTMLEVSTWGSQRYVDFDDYLAAANHSKDYGDYITDGEMLDMWISFIGNSISTNLFYIKEKT